MMSDWGERKMRTSDHQRH